MRLNSLLQRAGNHESWNPPRKTKFVRSTNPEGAVAEGHGSPPASSCAALEAPVIGNCLHLPAQLAAIDHELNDQVDEIASSPVKRQS